MIDDICPGDQRHERDANGHLTDWALACDALADNGCDCGCGPDERGTCLACVCERAMRTERGRAKYAETRHRRYADGIAGALREHREYRDTGEPMHSDVNAIRALAQRALAERATVEWIEKEATELGYDCDADEAVPDFMRRVCRERDEARALAGRLVDNGDRP